MKGFQGAMREQGLLMPYDLCDWLPEDHLARFIVDITDKLDFRNVYRQYQGKGTAAYDPKLLLSLLFVVEARAAERYKVEKKEYDQKMARRQEQEENTGKKPKGKIPKEPDSTPLASDQYNFTDPESRIMKTSRGFDQCYNAQAAVNEDVLLVGGYSNPHGNDKQEFIPVVNSVPGELGIITAAVADTGYFSENNVLKVQGQEIEPIIAVSREQHNSFLKTF